MWKKGHKDCKIQREDHGFDCEKGYPSEVRRYKNMISPKRLPNCEMNKYNKRHANVDVKNPRGLNPTQRFHATQK